MADKQVIRPSTKLVVAGYVVVALILAVLAYVIYGIAGQAFAPWHVLALALFFWPLTRHFQTRLLSMTVEGDHVTIESGLLSRSRRTFDLAKIQDVCANQSLGQRLLGTGDLTIETAGEKSSMSMKGIDGPRAVADMLLARSREVQRQRIHGTI